MPVYEYRCRDCGGDFEYQQRMTEPSKTVCESCGGALERLISRSAFHLKGSGWYKDLYHKPAASSDAAGKSAADSSPAKSAGDSSPSKASSSASSTSSSSGSSSSSSSGGSGSSASAARQAG